tara:strand:+ start:278 stop:421 length:144 start_codon:yes stop_codon:yes gene_type:complete
VYDNDARAKLSVAAAVTLGANKALVGAAQLFKYKRDKNIKYFLFIKF